MQQGALFCSASSCSFLYASSGVELSVAVKDKSTTEDNTPESIVLLRKRIGHLSLHNGFIEVVKIRERLPVALVQLDLPIIDPRVSDSCTTGALSTNLYL